MLSMMVFFQRDNNVLLIISLFQSSVERGKMRLKEYYLKMNQHLTLQPVQLKGLY